MYDISYQNACTELIEILKTISKEDFSKIPKKIIELIYENRNTNYRFKYSKYKSLDEQNVSITTKQMIIILFKNYFANEKQKEWIKIQEKIAIRKSEEEKKKRFDSTIIFKNNNKNKEHELQLANDNSKKIEQFIDKILDFIFGKRINIE